MRQKKRMKFAKQLQAERDRLSISQPQAAEILGIPFRTYWEWEHGKTEPYEITQEGALARLKKRKPKNNQPNP